MAAMTATSFASAGANGGVAALQARVRRLLGSRAEMEASRALLSTLVAAGDAENTSGGGGGVGLDLTAATAAGGGTLAELRRSLRASLENKQLSLAESALAGLGETLARLEGLRSQVDALDGKCARVQRFLETTKRETQQVQTEAAALARKTYVSHHWLGSFPRDRLLLTDAGVDAVSRCRASWTRRARSWGGTSSLKTRWQRCTRAQTMRSTGKRAAMARWSGCSRRSSACGRSRPTARRSWPRATSAARTYALPLFGESKPLDSRALILGVRGRLELLDAVGRHQEVGFERLYQWTAAKCAQMDEREPSSHLHRAIALLRDRPEFYKCGHPSFCCTLALPVHTTDAHCFSLVIVTARRV